MCDQLTVCKLITRPISVVNAFLYACSGQSYILLTGHFDVSNGHRHVAICNGRVYESSGLADECDGNVDVCKGPRRLFICTINQCRSNFRVFSAPAALSRLFSSKRGHLRHSKTVEE